MRSLILSRVSLVWFVLLGATLISWEVGHGVGVDDLRLASVLIIFISLVKVRFVLREFMELWHAPTALKLLGDAWLVALMGLLTVLYLVPMP